MTANQSFKNGELNHVRSSNMVVRTAAKLFGTRNARVLKKHIKMLKKVSEIENDFSNLATEDFPKKTSEFKERLSNGATIESLIPEAFALVREASKRLSGMRHYDVQILGGIVLNSGNIAEMQTGEGKTLVATLPSYLNALGGEQVHVVTVNDYLAKRDALLMSRLYKMLGMQVGYLQSTQPPHERKLIYQHADILYGTNSEFAFDYLRDNMAQRTEEQVQRGLSFAIVDEVDSILIDDARTPLIISGHAETDMGIISFMNDHIHSFTHAKLKEATKETLEKSEEDLIIVEKSRAVFVTEAGFDKLEALLVEHKVIEHGSSLYEPNTLHIVKSLETAARAHFMFQRDVDYVVTKDKAIEIINPTTGRIDYGRRWSEGLHQAVEAKEGVEIKPETRTMASISLQNFFKQYKKLSGMTGTGDTEAQEFDEIYGMEVVVVPTHQPNQRNDMNDRVYLTRSGKHKAIIEETIKTHQLGRPVLVGTDSVDESMIIAKLLESEGVEFNVLNAKNHELEAQIIAQAGRKGAITISTNMAGRGTDIILGGNSDDLISRLEHKDDVSIQAVKQMCKSESEIVKGLGGLHVISTTRNESRRVDNQLKGRAGRQGDPGSSVFFVSFEDKLLKSFGNSGMMQLLLAADVGEEECIEHSLLNKFIEKAQIQSEGQDSKVRAELVKYDNIVNMQRQNVYEMRNDWLEVKEEEAVERTKDLLGGSISHAADQFLPQDTFEEAWDADAFDTFIHVKWGIEPFIDKMVQDGMGREAIIDELFERVSKSVEAIADILPDHLCKELSVTVLLNTLDRLWFDQIDMLSNLREGIHLRGYAQKNPLQEYGRDSLSLFEEMVKTTIVDFSTAYFASAYATIQSYEAHVKQMKLKAEAEAKRLEEDSLDHSNESVASTSESIEQMPTDNSNTENE